MSAPRSPSGELPGRSHWPLIAVIVVPLAVRLAAAGAIHLTEDEAYYRLWSFTPAFGYYDHPPMIAWWIALGRRVAGDNPLGVRLLPIASCALTTLIVFDLARLAGAAERTARRSAIFFSAMPLIAAGGILAVPDAPASLFWVATLWCALKARGEGRTSWWLAAGLSAGLACLSKYSALFLAPGIGLGVLTTKEGRRELGRPGPWLAALVALAVFGFNIAWNAQHHWLTFAKQFGRVARGGLSPHHLPEFLIGQLLLINPLIAALAIKALGSRRIRADSPVDLSLFVATSAPFALYLAFHSLHAQVEAHWPAPIYPALAVCAAAGSVSRGWKWVCTGAAPLGFAAALAAALWLVVPAADLALPLDPALPIRGWSPFARALESERERAGAGWIAAVSYGLTAELASEHELRSPVVELYDRARYRDLQLGPPPDLAKPGLVVDLTRRVDLAGLRRCFAEVQTLGTLRRGDGGGPWKTYAAAVVSGARVPILTSGCPPAP
jgi:4-amino-4-deoxy-L-arabinose transferase-like glycosyltransferase